MSRKLFTFTKLEFKKLRAGGEIIDKGNCGFVSAGSKLGT